MQKNVAFDAGTKYVVKMDVNAESARTIKVEFGTSDEKYIAGTTIELSKGDNTIAQEIIVPETAESVEDGVFKVFLGNIDDSTAAGKLTFKNAYLMKVIE